MKELLPFLMIPGIFVSTFLLIFVLRRAQMRAMQGASRALGLQIQDGGLLGGGSRIVGMLDGVRVECQYVARRSKRGGTSYTRFAAWGAPPQVTVSRETTGQRILKALGSEDQHLGDPLFDDAFVVSGDPTWASAALSLQARAALVEAGVANTPVWVRGGEVGTRLDGSHFGEATVRARLQAVVRVVQAMQVDPADLLARLATVAREDSSPGVRARALALLAQQDAAAAEPVLRGALADPEVSVRMRAAALLRDPAATREVLRDPLLPDLARAQLLATLADPAVVGELVGLLDHVDADVRAAAVAGLATVGGRDEVAPLQALAEREGWGAAGARVAAAIAAIQGRLGGVEAGTLAVAEDELAGAVSEAGPTGAVSLAAGVGSKANTRA